MRDHIRILGILNIAMGCLTALIGVVALVFMGGIAGLISSGNPALAGDDARIAAPILAAVGVGVAVFLLILAAPSILGGWGLMNLRPWARIVIIIVSVLHLLNFPFGTALGVYGLWVLLSEQARRMFEGAPPAFISAGSYPQPNAAYPPGSANYPGSHPNYPPGQTPPGGSI